LNLVMEHLPVTLADASKHYTRQKQIMPTLEIKVRRSFTVQLNLMLTSSNPTHGPAALHVPALQIAQLHSRPQHLPFVLSLCSSFLHPFGP
jgi:hypothetical protein